MEFELRTDQVVRLAHIISPGQEKTLELSDPGTGKTPVVCVNQWRRATDLKMGTIWVMPKALMPKNVKEACRFTPFTERDVRIVDGTADKIEAAMTSGAPVLIMGPDRFKRVWEHIPAYYEALDVDDLHMSFGGAGGNAGKPSGRVEAFYGFHRRAKQGVMMTGTLINGRLDSAFPAINVIEPNYYPFGWDGFMADHAFCDEYGRPISWHGHEKLSQILSRHGIRYTFEQIFGKQEVVREIEWVAMKEKQRALYDEFEKEALLELDDFMVDGTLPGVATTRTRQLMEHPNNFPDLRGKEFGRVDIMKGERPAKLEALEVHFTDHNRRQTPVICFAAFIPQHHEIHKLARDMGRRPVIMNGEMSQKQKQDADEGFVEGRYDTMIGSPPVCSVGFNWQDWGPRLMETDHVINVSLTYKDSDFIQAYRRTIRRKRMKPLRLTTMAYMKCPVEMKVMSILKRKSRDAHKVDPTYEEIVFDSHGGDDIE